MKYIRNISDEQNKVGDTDNVFRLNLFEDTELFNFGTNALTVNIANSSGYILSLTPKKETGNTVIDLDFNDAPLKSLTPDDYLLEVEVKFSDGTIATFPTKGGMPFTVNGNLKETKGTLVPTVTFDNVLDAVDKKIAVYMDTVKVGPAGPIGPAGNVDTSHDNTFTGVNAFTQRIQGAIATRLANFTDLATVAADMYGYQGIWWFGSGTLLNSPVSSYVLVEVFHGSTKTNGYIRITSSISGDSYYANVNNGLSTWNKYAKDATVVHNTGTETVAGNKTFTGNNSFNGVPVLAQSSTVEFPMWYGSKMKATRFGNMVVLGYSQNPTQDIPSGTTSQETIPTGFRPSFDWYMNQGGVATNGGSPVKVKNSGNLSVVGSVSVTYPYTMTATYFTNDPFPSL